MARKKAKKTGRKEFSSAPFSRLKGVSVPAVEQKKSVPSESSPPPEFPRKRSSFAEEMALLGVVPIDQPDSEEDIASDMSFFSSEGPGIVSESPPDKPLSGDALFLAAMQDLEVRFTEPDYEEEDVAKTAPVPRRMKQLRQGRIRPEASLDLHGLKRSDVAPRLKHFIQDARYHGWQTLLVITGRGLHSERGEAVLRQETEDALNRLGKEDIAEWGRAPRNYGGAGALVVFLKNKS